MNSYLLLKYLHILSATVVAGTGIGIAWFLWMASRQQNVAAVAATARHVVIADWVFTTPAVAIQLITGVLLMKTLNYSFASQWFLVVIGLFAAIGLCWMPVVYIQYRIRNLLKATGDNAIDQKQLNGLMRIWTALGVVAFAMILVIFWLMVFKPLPLM